MHKLLFLLFIFSFLSASSQKVEGTVKDADGNILPFASVLVKGTSMGVTANNEGKFSLNLSRGNYTLDCRYVGYTSSQKQITVSSNNLTVNFNLNIQKLTLKEVIIKKRSEGPAYAIIRQAIKKRPFYDAQVKAFEAQVYIKGMIRVMNLPNEILGQKIPHEDRILLGLDSSGEGIVYLKNQ
jgi:hypothetical protein